MERTEKQAISDNVVILDKDEYEVLFNWYSEWVRICKLLTTFSFAAIGFTMLIFDIKKGHSIPADQIELIKMSWAFLGVGGLLSGASIALAYLWLDSFSRSRMPSLIGKVVFSKSFIAVLRVGTAGWLVTLSAAFCTLAGLYYFISAAWKVL